MTPPAARLLLIDCFDSFTYNLAQGLAVLGAEVTVVRNDAVDVAGVLAFAADGLVLSPGPGRPEDTGVCPSLLAALPAARPTLPVLGVCLGHQLIALHAGAAVVRAGQPIHGKVWAVRQTAAAKGAAVGARPGPASASGPAMEPDPLWQGVPDPLLATRYHSLLVEPGSLPPDLEVTAVTDEGEVMALRHRQKPLWGVQFHPESIGCPAGPVLLGNFVRECLRRRAQSQAQSQARPPAATGN